MCATRLNTSNGYKHRTRQQQKLFFAHDCCSCIPATPVLPACHQSPLQFPLSQSAASPTHAHLDKHSTISDHITLWVCKMARPSIWQSRLLTIFGCVSNPFSAQPWSCGSSAWRHCVSVDPYGAEHREGGTNSSPSTSYTHFARLGFRWDLWGGGSWGEKNGSLLEKTHTFAVTTSQTKTKTSGSGGFFFFFFADVSS